MSRIKGSKLGFVLGTVLLGVLTGCVGYVEEPHAAYAPESVVVVSDDYIYYPSYQVYYSSSRRHYIYRDGRSWVSRPVPPHVSVNVLAASPSVKLDFHDHPSIHHAAVVRQYPKRWVPPKASDRR